MRKSFLKYFIVIMCLASLLATNNLSYAGNSSFKVLTDKQVTSVNANLSKLDKLKIASLSSKIDKMLLKKNLSVKNKNLLNDLKSLINSKVEKEKVLENTKTNINVENNDNIEDRYNEGYYLFETLEKKVSKFIRMGKDGFLYENGKKYNVEIKPNSLIKVDYLKIKEYLNMPDLNKYIIYEKWEETGVYFLTKDYKISEYSKSIDSTNNNRPYIEAKDSNGKVIQNIKASDLFSKPSKLDQFKFESRLNFEVDENLSFGFDGIQLCVRNNSDKITINNDNVEEILKIQNLKDYDYFKIKGKEEGFLIHSHNVDIRFCNIEEAKKKFKKVIYLNDDIDDNPESSLYGRGSKNIFSLNPSFSFDSNLNSYDDLYQIEAGCYLMTKNMWGNVNMYTSMLGSIEDGLGDNVLTDVILAIHVGKKSLGTITLRSSKSLKVKKIKDYEANYHVTTWDLDNNGMILYKAIGTDEKFNDYDKLSQWLQREDPITEWQN